MPEPTAMQARHTEAGARFTRVAGVPFPEAYGDTRSEYEALRHRAGLVDLSFRALLTLRGSDATSFLNNMVTNDVASLQDGQGCGALKVSLQGKVEAALRVLCVEDALWCDLEPGPRDAFVETLRKRIILSAVDLDDASAQWALLSLQGPQATAALTSLGVDVQALQTQHANAAATLGGVSARVVRSDHSGEGGYDIFVAVDQATKVWDTLLGAPGVQPVGLAALDARRIEAGIPWDQHEITGDRLPQEVGLEDGWINYTKGCYLGQETVARLHHLGHVNRHLRGLIVEGDRCPALASVLQAQGKEVGTITSAALSPRLGRPVALAYVRRAHAEPGSRLEVVDGASTLPAEVTQFPIP